MHYQKRAISVTQFFCRNSLSTPPSSTASRTIWQAARLCGSRGGSSVQPRKRQVWSGCGERIPTSEIKIKWNAKKILGFLTPPRAKKPPRLPPDEASYSTSVTQEEDLKKSQSPCSILCKPTSADRQGCCLVTWLCRSAVKHCGPTWGPLHFNYPHLLCNQEGEEKKCVKLFSPSRREKEIKCTEEETCRLTDAARCPDN